MNETVPTTPRDVRTIS